MGPRASAEESYSRYLGNASALVDAAHRFAEAGDAPSALAAAWGADVYAAQAVVWERIMVAATSPQRQFFRVAEALLRDLADDPDAAPDARSVADVVTAGRTGILEDCEPDLRRGLTDAWTDLSYLSALPAPTATSLRDAAQNRLGGLGPASFVAQRRREAAESMSAAQGLRIRGESVAAIETAYESDLSGLEGYLVESAIAAGDEYLLTVMIRWQLATAALAALPGLPEGFVAAVNRIRDALVYGLGDADGTRLRAFLVQI